MIQLDTVESLCDVNQKIIVSKDLRTSRMHRAINQNGVSAVRQFKLDGGIVKQRKCCDFLILNDTKKNAYFVELKGGNIHEAVSQFEESEKILRSSLEGYNYFYRIVCSKVITHNVARNSFRKFQDKVGVCLKYKTNLLEENI